MGGKNSGNGCLKFWEMPEHHIRLISSFQATPKSNVKSQPYTGPQAQLSLLPQFEPKIWHCEMSRTQLIQGLADLHGTGKRWSVISLQLLIQESKKAWLLCSYRKLFSSPFPGIYKNSKEVWILKESETYRCAASLSLLLPMLVFYWLQW